jgi:hypothetical protein
VKSKGISAPNTKFHNYTTLLTTIRAKEENNKSYTEFGTNKNVVLKFCFQLSQNVLPSAGN